MADRLSRREYLNKSERREFDPNIFSSTSARITKVHGPIQKDEHNVDRIIVSIIMNDRPGQPHHMMGKDINATELKRRADENLLFAFTATVGTYQGQPYYFIRSITDVRILP